MPAVHPIHEPRAEEWRHAFFRNVVFYASLFLVGFACLGGTLATDGTPDFKIYHYYNGFAAHHDRSALDIFPAQLQTALSYVLDSTYYILFGAFNHHPTALNVILSIPYSLAAFLVFLMARLFLPERFPLRDLACAGVAVFGLTGAGALPTMATTMSDIVPGLPLLVAVTAWLYLEKANRNTIRSAFLVGAMGGLSVALKMTMTPLFVGLFCATALRRALGVKTAFAQALALGMAGLLVFVAVDAHWLVRNFQSYGNPLFPFMNHVFRSDLVDHHAWTDLRFMPKSMLMALFYPAYWAIQESTLVCELNMRDARILIGLVSALLVLGAYVLRLLRQRATAPAVVETLGLHVAVMFIGSFVLWEYVWSIYRYLSVLECLVGVLLMIALTRVLGRRGHQGSVLIALAAIMAVTMATTHYPWWSRAQRTGRVFSAQLPSIEPNAMVVLLDPYAYSFLVPSMPESVRVVGANSNLVRPGSWGRLEKIIEDAIREHRGPLWGMEYPDAFPGVADTTLKHHRLERDAQCVLVDTNIEARPIVRACHLRRGE